MAFFRRLLAIEAAAFAAAALIHTGVVVGGFTDTAAATAESIIGLVLAVAAGLTWSRPEWTRPVALAAQGFALAGSLIGLYLAVRGVGPSTMPDIVFHAGIVLTLAYGTVAAWLAQ
jgi:hypothetical protein